LVAEYAELLKKSEALVIASYTGVKVKNVEQLRRKVRDASGELHVVKNTLATVALKAAGMPVPEEMLKGDTAIGFAFKDVPGVAKAIQDFTKDSEFVKVKGGVMSGKILNAKEIESLASLPPMPVVRAQLLGLINAPATRIAGSIASAVRQVVNVTKAYADKGQEATA
jgi:large subunit ribosomal protein L10